MSKDIKSDHLKLIKNMDQYMKDFIEQGSTKPAFKIGEGAFGGDMIYTNAGISPVGSTPVMVPQNFKEFFHILMRINIPKQLKQKKRRRVVGRRAFDRVAVSRQGSDKGKINQGNDHFDISTLDISIGQDFHKSFFKLITRKKNKTGKRHIIV